MQISLSMGSKLQSMIEMRSISKSQDTTADEESGMIHNRI